MFMIVYVIVVEGPSLKLKLQFHISSQSQTKSMLLDASYHARPHPSAPADRRYRNASRCAAPGPSGARGHSSPESCCTSPSRAANAARTHLKELGISPRSGDFNGDMMVFNLEIVDNWDLKNL